MQKFVSLIFGILLDWIARALEYLGSQTIRVYKHLFHDTTCLSLFHWLVGVCYFSAFLSLYLEWDGLLSYNGIEPVDLFVDRVRAHFLRGDKQLASISLWTTGAQLFRSFGSIVALAPELGMTPDGVSQVLLLVGLMCSALIVSGLPLRLLFFCCWISYLSLQHVGQTFLSFQWDILLLEVGFLSIFSSIPAVEYIWPCATTPSRRTSLTWCYRFLAWKLMFLSGVVKIQARCPTWESLSALEYHFATQCLPTPLAWMLHQLPPIILRASVAATLILEIPLAFLLLSSLRRMRRIGAAIQIVFQLLIAATGNYNFFNILTTSLMVMVWSDDNDDNAKSVGIDKGNQSANSADNGSFNSVLERASAVALKVPFLYQNTLKAINESKVGQSAVSACTYLFIIFWSISFVTYRPPSHAQWDDYYWTGEGIRLKVKWANLAPLMPFCCALAMYWTLVHAGWHSAHHICKHLHSFALDRTAATSQPSLGHVTGSAVIPTIKAVVHLTFALCWIMLSATSLSTIANMDQFIPSRVQIAAKTLSPLTLVSSYGLFRSMTGVSARQGQGQVRTFIPSIVARPELVLQGLHPDTQQWIEIPFPHKPVDPMKRPTMIAPLQPRLDWQMWFAALGPYNHSPWLLHVLYRLLRDSRDSGVVRLLGKDYPAWGKQKRPQAIRVVRYEYDFTRWNTTWARSVPEAALIPIPEITFGSEFMSALRAFFLVPPSTAVVQSTCDDTAACYAKDHRQVVSSDHAASTAWYFRKNPREFLPPLTTSTESLRDYVREAGYDPDRAGKIASNERLYKACVDKSSDFTSLYRSISRTACRSLLVRKRVLHWLTRNSVVPRTLLLLLALILNRRKFE